MTEFNVISSETDHESGRTSDNTNFDWADGPIERTDLERLATQAGITDFKWTSHLTATGTDTTLNDCQDELPIEVYFTLEPTDPT